MQGIDINKVAPRTEYQDTQLIQGRLICVLQELRGLFSNEHPTLLQNNF